MRLRRCAHGNRPDSRTEGRTPPSNRLPSGSRTRPSSSSSLRVADRALAAFVEQRPPDDRAELVERALRIGLHALQDAGTSLDVDVVRREFDALLERRRGRQRARRHALDQVLRQNFADRDGRLPRTLEKFLGDRGQLRLFVNELFDEGKRDSAIGRMRELLGNVLRRRRVAARAAAGPHTPGLAAAPVPGTRSAQGFDEAQRAPDGDRGGAGGTRHRARQVRRQGRGLRGRCSRQMLGDDCARHRGLRRPHRRRGRRRDPLQEGRLRADGRPASGAAARTCASSSRPRTGGSPAARCARSCARRSATAAPGRRSSIFTPAHAPAGIAPFDVRARPRLLRHRPGGAGAGDPGEAAVRLARASAVATLRSSSHEVDAARVAR